jgi:hypothetical protein
MATKYHFYTALGTMVLNKGKEKGSGTFELLYDHNTGKVVGPLLFLQASHETNANFVIVALFLVVTLVILAVIDL